MNRNPARLSASSAASEHAEWCFSTSGADHSCDCGPNVLRRIVEQEIALTSMRQPRIRDLADAALAAVPDGWAKVDGGWIRIAD